MNFVAQHWPEIALTAFMAIWIGVVAWAFRGGHLGSDDD